MRGWRAALWKDLRLFRTGVGWITILLPLLLLLALQAMGGETLRSGHIEPFPIAVRDEDGTVMSRSLIRQMDEIELFSQVARVTEETDGELLDQGFAAVMTIPKDLFYTAYYMRSDPVRIVLNRAMPVESSLFRTMVASVMKIMEADQAASRAVYHFCYGTLTGEQEMELWNEASEQLIADALGRQRIFDAKAEAAEAEEQLRRDFFSCALSVLCLFFALAAVKTLPEELSSGVLPRFLAAGGRWSAFFLSKLVTGLLMALPSLLLLLWVFQPRRWGMVLALSALLFLSAFGQMLAVAAWAGERSGVLRWGNLILLVSLTLGGGIYRLERLPDYGSLLGRLTLPYYARLGLGAMAFGGTPGQVAAGQWPILLMGALGWVLAWGGLRQGKTRLLDRRPEKSGGEPEAGVPVFGTPGRLASIAARRALAMSGGGVGLVCLLCCTALCAGAASAALSGTAPEDLPLAVALEGDGPLAEQMIEQMGSQPGISVQRVFPAEGEGLVSQGKVEGLLILDREYDRDLKEGKNPTLTYRSAPGAASARAAREIIAGQVALQRAEERALGYAEEKLGHPLTAEEETALRSRIAQEREEAHPLYSIAEKGGEAPLQADPFAPNQLGFGALAMMLALFTWAAWTGRIDARRVERRMCALPGGRGLSYGGDVLALWTLGLAVGLCALLPGGRLTGRELLAAAAYDICVTGLALAMTRWTALDGRMDLLAPFVALITCLIGGCFGNAGALSPAVARLSRLTPQGLALRVQAGEGSALILLILGSGLFLLLGAPQGIIKERGKRNGLF